MPHADTPGSGGEQRGWAPPDIASGVWVGPLATHSQHSVSLELRVLAGRFYAEKLRFDDGAARCAGVSGRRERIML